MSTFLRRIFNKEVPREDELLQLESKLSLERSKLDVQLLSAHFEDEKPIPPGFNNYMQAAINAQAGDKIPLVEEQHNLERYIAFYKYYKGDEILVQYDFPLEVQQFSISPFILFPLIQNALHYGYHVGAKFPLRIKGRVSGNYLILEVSNRVNHYVQDQSKIELIRLFKSRLEQEYPERYELILNSNSNIFRSSLRLQLLD